LSSGAESASGARAAPARCRWGEDACRGAARRCGALFFCVVAVGDERVWVRESFVLRDPNDDMGLLFVFQVLEIA
jgi:hypothetical protein